MKAISIITPHFNDIKGILNIKECLSAQTSDLWEWIIVDDCSDKEVQEKLKAISDNSEKITVILNNTKTNASFCRNLGADKAKYNKLIFLDADDTILPDFVKNRLVEVKEFTVFQNFRVQRKGGLGYFKGVMDNFKVNFLRANFGWQTTCVLWDKDFFFKIGKFDANLKLLQDVELVIRAMLEGSNYKIITNNEVDFYYDAPPIDVKKRTLVKVSESTLYMIDKLLRNYSFDKKQTRYLACYYFLCLRYFVLEVNSSTQKIIENTLKEFYKNRCINFWEYLFGKLSLTAFRLKVINKDMLIKTNRKVFKTSRF